MSDLSVFYALFLFELYLIVLSVYFGHKVMIVNNSFRHAVWCGMRAVLGCVSFCFIFYRQGYMISLAHSSLNGVLLHTKIKEHIIYSYHFDICLYTTYVSSLPNEISAFKALTTVLLSMYRTTQRISMWQIDQCHSPVPVLDFSCSE